MTVKQRLEAFEDPLHEGNSHKHHTGKACREVGCVNPAGTAWSPYWCFEHNVARLKRISAQLDDIVATSSPGRATLKRLA